jgi:hypothetical protein
MEREKKTGRTKERSERRTNSLACFLFPSKELGDESVNRNNKRSYSELREKKPHMNVRAEHRAYGKIYDLIDFEFT